MPGTLDPRRCALLAVDMQRYFLDTRYQAGIATDASTVEVINLLAEALRAAGGVVLWIVTDGSAEGAADWTVHRERMGEAAWAARCRDLAPGSEGASLHPGLAPDPADITFVKTRFSAFLRAPVDLDALLRGRGIDTLLVTGVTTDVCCESTMRDAMMLNYRVFAVEDGLAAADTTLHEAALNALCPRFAERVDGSAALALLGTG